MAFLRFRAKFLDNLRELASEKSIRNSIGNLCKAVCKLFKGNDGL